jgi:hypothetical protein
MKSSKCSIQRHRLCRAHNAFLAHFPDQWPAGGRRPDAESAIAKAIEEFKITDPKKQRRLIAQLQQR